MMIFYTVHIKYIFWTFIIFKFVLLIKTQICIVVFYYKIKKNMTRIKKNVYVYLPMQVIASYSFLTT